MRKSALGTPIGWTEPKRAGTPDMGATPSIKKGGVNPTIPGNPYLSETKSAGTPDVSPTPLDKGQIPVSPYFGDVKKGSTPDVSPTPVNSTP